MKKKTKKNKIVLQGWECPKCGSVWAIWMKECEICNDKIHIYKNCGQDWTVLKWGK